ncbi:heat-shock protein Hsp20 [Rhodoferax lacus]|uniref:Heat-shock protein Hsp20 n=1 Tax=Rhodoferax lacus TaxID=2184758 RepID=A0A3E1R670_9BURK|nr:Hsp20 family protein [Rhodoferax lacus]RFO94869.1 heat-shock protein Hsp20 [Rhodoferax lacus]
MNKLRILDKRLNDSMERMFRRAASSWKADWETDLSDIRVDMVEVNGAYKVLADLPGVKKEDISVRIDGNRLQIDAHAYAVKNLKDHGITVLRNERRHGTLRRAFTLAQDVDEGKVVAKFSDGLLQLELPKKVASLTDSKMVQVQ